MAMGGWDMVSTAISQLDSDTSSLMTTLCSFLSQEIVTSQFSQSKQQTMVKLATNSWQMLKHSRGCSATHSWNSFGHQFATSSRDNTMKIWSTENEAQIKKIIALPQFGSSVTTVAWTGLDRKEKSGCVAVGTDRAVDIKIIETKEGTKATAALALHLAVNRLAWRPTETNQSLLRLTSCGDDNCVRFE